MELTFKKRLGKNKSELTQLRRNDSIPAIIYSKGNPEGEKVAVSNTEFKTALRRTKSGCLSTKVFTLKGEGATRRVLVKDIQYHRTTYDVLHLDFEELKDDQLVKVNVPIQCIGVLECPGIKLGGILRQVNRSMRVECLPKDIPNEFIVDIADLGIMQTKRLRDITVPQSVRPIAKLDDVAVVIAKR